MSRMGKTEEEWNGLKLGLLKTVQPNSFSKLIPAGFNFKNNAQETFVCLGSLILSFTCNFFAYFKRARASNWKNSTKRTGLPWHSPLREALNKQICFTKATSARKQMFMKRRIFLRESAFRPHEASESAHGNLIFLVTILLSGVRPATTRTWVKWYAVSKMSRFVWTAA